jgi:quercetin dioxygenase-like cupin family protein
MDFSILTYNNRTAFEDEAITVTGFHAPGQGRRLELGPAGTAFIAVTSGLVWIDHIPLLAGQYASSPLPATLFGRMDSRVMVVTAKHYRGLFAMGGPVEEQGRLKYIDGCTDTGIIAPPRLGDPCLNALFFPKGTRQTPHYHPSHRVGMVLDGMGLCHHGESITPMTPGDMWIIPARCWHWFETAADALRIVAFHPDSEVGPTDESHQMLDATLTS